jgi:membrane dipeptidase
MSRQADWRARHPDLADAILCDGLLPWSKTFLPPGASLADVLRRFWSAGVDHISLTAAAGSDDHTTALVRLGFLNRELRNMADWVRIAAEPEQIRQARVDGMLSVAFHFQTATPFTADLELVDAFRAAGIGRSILAYNEGNAFADGCHEPRNGGLTALGRRLLDRMDAAGMRVDVSHCGERTSLDALAAPLSRAPLFSHSNARALYDHERNITDAQIRACAARGGYIGVNGVGMFLGVEGPDLPRTMAEHAAHIAGIAGADRVGLGLDFMYLEGSDYDFFHASAGRWPRGYPTPPWSFLQPEHVGDLVDALVRVGFSTAELRGILGENYLRLAA